MVLDENDLIETEVDPKVIEMVDPKARELPKAPEWLIRHKTSTTTVYHKTGKTDPKNPRRSAAEENPIEKGTDANPPGPSKPTKHKRQAEKDQLEMERARKTKKNCIAEYSEDEETERARKTKKNRIVEYSEDESDEDEESEWTVVGRAGEAEKTAACGANEPSGTDKNRHRKPSVIKGSHLVKVLSCGWAKDSKHLVSAGRDGKLMVWDTYSDHRVHSIPLKSNWIMSCCFSQKSARFVASGGMDNVCTVYALHARKDNVYTSQEFSEHTAFVSCCRFIDDTDVITASGDRTVMLWDVSTGKRKSEFTGHSDDIMSLSVAPDKRTFITGACDATARLWDIRDGFCRQSFAGMTEIHVNQVVYHPTNLAFACLADMEDDPTAPADSCMCLFDLRSDNKIGETRAYRYRYTSMDFTRSGRLAVVGTTADPALFNPAAQSGPSKMIVYDALKLSEKDVIFAIVQRSYSTKRVVPKRAAGIDDPNQIPNP
ncbi:guanine nucleotide-binding protein subunit beta-like [Symsagittifera roscoffensis]|uniref:guanine nucleotide-binding protein subunit beta-like n=1 Tax=Symsagittifera roscoffensis TaxID=84072 RepID=UPI00307B615C